MKSPKRKLFLKIIAAVAGLAAALAVFAYYFLFSLPSAEEIKNIPPVSTKILDRNGNLLYEIYGESKRTPVSLNEISPWLQMATVAAEDKNFYSHGGISLPAIARAAWVNYRSDAIIQGGSTITQQVVKNIFLSRKKSFSRKIKEAVLAQRLEGKLPKNDILGLYLNTVPYGRNTYGAEAASQSYFGKAAKDLNLAESTYLAALPQAPSYYSPTGANLEALKQRQQYILSVLAQQKKITPQQERQAASEQAAFLPLRNNIKAPYFVKWVEQSLIRQYGEKTLEEQGFTVYTTLDENLQQEAEQIVKDGIKAYAKKYNVHNASLVAIDPQTGEVLAMVGGEGYFDSPYPAGCQPGINCQFDPMFNTALALRQPGSSFKPYTYITAFSPEFKFAPASIVMDIKKNFSPPGIKPYIPNNFDGSSHGAVSMRKALAGSLNIAAVQTLSLVGTANVIATAQSLGITSPLTQCGLSLTLGACEVTLLEHTAAYGAFANQGVKMPTTYILKITDKAGNVIKPNVRETGKRVLDPRAVYELDSVLSDNQARSFIFGSRSPLYFKDRIVAAKTGTSQDFKDAWTIGFTPQLVAGVWAGNNDGSLMKGMADGVMVAAPIWHNFMEAALKGQPTVSFAKPEGIEEVYVSASSGKLAASYTENPVKEIFADYAVPVAYDPLPATSTSSSTLTLLNLRLSP
ncbi:MAG: PBP1A family penicillin-binding protein [Patescibacteria group bacterium]|nr:PBP1A family penicillin-binding protein [Patescibacteria group bacterium]